MLDARNGNSTATWLRENIVYAIGGALVDLYSRLYESNPLSSQPPAPSTSDIERTLKCTFKQLDHDIVHGSVDRVLSTQAASHSSKVDPLARAYSGSSALVGFYDSNSRDLHAALTGDSRAVLGRRMQGKNSDVGYQAHVLTVEQDGGNLAEEYRLNARHPGEVVVYAGRFLSGGPTRSFGDAMYKCQDRNTHRQLQDASQAVGQPVPSHVKSPPYLTAEPEVTSTSVQPGDFLIMGTRGIWDRLTSEEAVGPIGTWLDEQRQRQSEHTKKNPAISANDFPVSPLEVNAWQDETDDRNAATHLMKNALSRHLSGEGSVLLYLPEARPMILLAGAAASQSPSSSSQIIKQFHPKNLIPIECVCSVSTNGFVQVSECELRCHGTWVYQCVS